MIEGADPCIDGLSRACFESRPEHAKQVLAYRFMGMLVGAEYMKRLQKFKGLFLPISLAESMGLSLDTLPSVDVYSSLPPILISVFEPGPLKPRYEEEEVLIMPTIRRAKIDFSEDENAEIVPAVAGKNICIANIALVVGGETILTFKSDITPLSGPMNFGGTDEPRGMTHGLGSYPLRTLGGQGFFITSSLAVQVSGYVTYYLD